MRLSGRESAPGAGLRAFYVAVIGAWLLGAELVVIATVRGGLPAPLGVLGGGTFVLASGGLLAVIGRRDLANRRDLGRLLHQHQEALASLSALTAASLAILPLDRLLDELLVRLQEVLGVDAATILLLAEGGTDLAVRASRGFEELVTGGTLLRLDEGLAAQIAGTHEPVVVDDVARADGVPQPLRGLASLAGCPIEVRGAVIGACLVGTRVRMRFTDRDIQLLQLVADRAGVGIERSRLDDAERRSRLAAEHARRHLALLARAAETLSTALQEYEPNLAALVDVVVPEFADWCSLDVVSADGSLRNLAVRHGDERGPLGSLRLAESLPEWPVLAERAVAEARPHLQWSPASDVAPVGGTEDGDGADAAGGRSYLVAPIRARGRTVGVITCVTDPGRRGYRSSDRTVAEELAGRAAITVERVLLYREVEEAAQASERTAAQLRQLVEASLNLQGPRTGADILPLVASYAQRVFDGDVAVVTAQLGGGRPLRAVARKGAATACAPLGAPEVAVDLPAALEAPSRLQVDGRWLAAPLPRQGLDRGSLAIDRHEDREATADDQAMVALLAQMTSAALDSAELYDGVQTREARWRALIEATPAGIVEVDLAGRILLWNRFAATMFGWTDTAEAGRATPSFPGDAAAEIAVLCDRAAERRETLTMELSGVEAGGRTRELTVSAAPLVSGGDTVQGILTLAVDVTDQKLLERGMREAQRMEAIGQVAGGVAHDFNNLLTVITGYSDLLRRRVDLDDSSTEMLAGISDAADRAALLTGQLLTIGRRQDAKPVVIEPNLALRSLAEVLERILGIDIALRWSLDPDVGNISIDPARLEQLILNLAINARDAMPTGGRLEIASALAPIGLDEAAALDLEPGRYVHITVADTGVGMDEETRRRCFEAFFTTKERAKGTGLGLAAVHGIVAEIRGTVAVSSEPGRGTRFDLYLPSSQDVVAAAVAEPAQPVLRGAETVLVVEDQADVRRLICRVLDRDGYLVLAAADGASAIKISDKWEGPIELVLSDVVMPDLRGPEVVAALKKSRPAVAVLYLSGYTDGTTVPAGLPSDTVGFLAKPFKPSELSSRVRDVLDEHRRRTRNGTQPPGPS